MPVKKDLTEKEWNRKRLAYMGQCSKCHAPRLIIKGSLHEFGIGVYICSGCDTIYMPGKKPKRVDLIGMWKKVINE